VPSKEKRSSLALYLFFAVLFSIQILPRLSLESLTNDEPSDITNGYYFWTRGDVVTPHNHPPLGSALQALPLLWMNLKTSPFMGDVIDRGHFFIFQWNLDKLEAITRASRTVSWILGLALGFLIWRVTRARLMFSIFALFFWAFDPTLSALSGLAKTDIAPTFLFFFSVLAFEKAKEEPTIRNSIFAGIAAGLAVNSKFYCLVLIPVFLILDFFFYRQTENVLFLRERRIEIRGRWIHGVGVFLVTTFLLFLPATLFMPDHHQPFRYVLDKFKEDLVFVRNPFPVYFLGTSGLESHWYYLPAAFLMKEPIAFLFLLFLGLMLALLGKIKLPFWIWVPPLLFCPALLPSLNLGVRYLLPLYPFLFLIAAEGSVWLWNGGPVFLTRSFCRTLVLLLFLWQAVSIVLSYPRMISYFNEFIPPDKKIQYLADSNLDWGQDQKRLAELARQRGWTNVHLAYSGGIDPQYYGLNWTPWTEADLAGPQPGTVYIINASFLQLGPLAYPSVKPIAESWITGMKPTGQVGDSWYYFEVPGKAEASSKGPYLFSAPFLQYRGYRPFSPLKDP